jgi:xylulokinase
VSLPNPRGERPPHNNPLATGSWTGLRAQHGREQLAYAVAEGVGFGLLDGLCTIPPADPPLRSLSLVGGGSRSAWWAQLLADTFGLSLTVHQDAESGGAMGAARLAWLACGGDLETVCTTPPVRQRFDPDPARGPGLRQRHAQFRALYPALNARGG